jgi:phosphohistidine swiveling domain-containing protein
MVRRVSGRRLVWNAPTVDAQRGVIYSGTGPAYAGDDPNARG